MNKLTFLLLLTLGLVSCKKDNVATGSIFVKVQSQNGTVIPNAQISTSPVSGSGKTNATGSLSMNDVPVGIYEVTATHSNFGSGVGSVAVKDGEVGEVTIKLVAGVFLGPRVQISQPYSSSHYVGDEIKFVASASHDELSLPELAVEWSSSIDGVLNTDPANTSGRISFVTSELSEGEHTVTVKVTDNESKTAESFVNLVISNRPDPVVFNDIEVLNDGLSLSWSTFTGSDFVSYRVLKSSYQNGNYSVISEINDINTTTFVDDGYLSFGHTYTYRIDVLDASFANSESNVQEVIYEFENIDVGSTISRMLVDPSRPYLYALDNEKNELLFINKDSKTVEKSIYVGSSPQDMDMNDDYSKLYVANNGSSLVAVVDLGTQEKVNDLQVEVQTGYSNNPYSIVWLKGDFIAYTLEDSYGKIHIANAQTGALVSDNISNVGKNLSTNAAHDKLYVSSESRATIFGVNNGVLTEIDKTATYYYSGQEVLLTNDEAHIFYGKRKFPANNLDILLGTFDESIRAINSDGSIAVGSRKIYNGNMFSEITELPFLSYVKVIDTDDKTLFSFHSDTKKIYLTELD